MVVLDLSQALAGHVAHHGDDRLQDTHDEGEAPPLGGPELTRGSLLAAVGQVLLGDVDALDLGLIGLVVVGLEGCLVGGLEPSPAVPPGGAGPWCPPARPPP